MTRINNNYFETLIRERHPEIASDDAAVRDLALELAHEWERNGGAPDGYLQSVTPERFLEDRMSGMAQSRGILSLLSRVSRPVAPAPAPVDRAEMATELASRLHDDWRRSRFRPETGLYEPRMKTTRDQAWIDAHGGVTQVDIANTAYRDLPTDWQAENGAAAEVAVSLVLERVARGESLDDPRWFESASSEVHEQWRVRNGHRTDDDFRRMDVPFNELETEALRDLDRAHVRAAIALFNDEYRVPVRREVLAQVRDLIFPEMSDAAPELTTAVLETWAEMSVEERRESWQSESGGDAMGRGGLPGIVIQAHIESLRDRSGDVSLSGARTRAVELLRDRETRSLIAESLRVAREAAREGRR